MPSDSLLDRSLWPIVLAVVVAVVVLSFAKGPLSGSDGAAGAETKPLTLWVAGGETAGETETLAHQLAACGQLGGHAATVGVLSGGSVQAVQEFLTEVRGVPNELLLLTSSLLSEVAYDARQPPDTEVGELGRTTAHMLRHAEPVAVLGEDRLALAVSERSAFMSTTQLLESMRLDPSRPLLGTAAEAWLEGGLAALARSADVEGEMPFTAYSSSREAIASLGGSTTRAVVAPHSAVAGQTREGKLRELAWPRSRAPQGWVAILAPSGIGRGSLAELRSEALDLCSGAKWRQQLHSDGLTAPPSDSSSLQGLIDSGLDEASRLQALAASTVRNY